MQWKDALGVLQGISIIVASFTAIYSIRAWRRQLIGSKRSDVAEATLVAFYKARDILQSARTAAIQEGYGGNRVREEGESDAETSIRNALFAPADHLLKESEFFSSVEAARHRFSAYFGPDATTCFDTIKALRNRVIDAARRRSRYEGNQAIQPDVTPEQVSRWDVIIGWKQEEPDKFSQELDEIVYRIETLCRPILSEENPETRFRVLRRQMISAISLIMTRLRGSFKR